MTAEQLEELLSMLDNGHTLDPGMAMDELFSLAPSLARRVIAAERMCDELEKCEIMLRERGLLAQADASETALTAYREASK